jgi:hypothetical protein
MGDVVDAVECTAAASPAYWREAPLQVDGVLEGTWGRWAVEIKTGAVGTTTSADSSSSPALPRVSAASCGRPSGTAHGRASRHRVGQLARLPSVGPAQQRMTTDEGRVSSAGNSRERWGPSGFRAFGSIGSRRAARPIIGLASVGPRPDSGGRSHLLFQ